MNCDRVQSLIDGYLDGELDLVNNLAIEKHLRECSSCAQSHKNRQLVHDAIQSNSLAYKAPLELQKRVRSALRQQKNAGSMRILPQKVAWRWLAAATLFVAIVLITWNVAATLTAPSAAETLIQELLSSHIRSLMVNHLVDVASQDQHTVKPWFDGKLDYAPPVVDLAQQGFPLIGGRLDYLNSRTTAALVYKHGNHVINLFILPSASSLSSYQNTSLTRQGYHLILWHTSAMTFCAISDLEESQLQHFVQLLQQQLASP
ncbi:MAG TPA: anti-sigma factor [Ktedonobacteraceae bacterium]|nr:anti-sigma factor [Ktedonobacteraceae bacterium]